MPVEKPYYYKPVRKPKALPPKLTKIIKLAKGGSANGDEDKPNNNVVPLPIKPGTEADWMKTANRSELLDLLMKYGGFGEKYLKDLSDDELKELNDYSIQTGGMG